MADAEGGVTAGVLGPVPPCRRIGDAGAGQDEFPRVTLVADEHALGSGRHGSRAPGKDQPGGRDARYAGDLLQESSCSVLRTHRA